MFVSILSTEKFSTVPLLFLFQFLSIVFLKQHMLSSGTYDSVQFSSVAQSCRTLCDPMNRSTPGLPVHYQLLEFTQTHVHQVCDVIQPSHPLSPLLLLPPIPPSIRVLSNESTLRIRQPKYWSFSFNISPTNEQSGLISLQSKGLSSIFSNTTVQKHQFFGAQLSLQSNSHIHT